jgi:phospholipid/cholesterol/gamma-HCH transport system permease protein
VTARGFDPSHRRLLALVHERMRSEPSEAHARHLGLVQRIGHATVDLALLLRSHTRFLGLVTLDVASLLRRPGRFRMRETVSQFEDAGLDAIPIVALVTFLIGVVFAYLLGVQAQRYGANIFVVDGVGMAVARELSPMLAAIIVAGRSGAAFTAQLGTMRVQEEVDAIATLGLSPIQVLVVPRLVAVMVGLPLLAFVGDAAGIAGGMVVAAWQLEISPATFLDRLHATLPLGYFVVGLAKTPVFAAFIALIACRMGLSVARDARSVGLNTTSTVVQSIVAVIVLDAFFAVALQHLGL